MIYLGIFISLVMVIFSVLVTIGSSHINKENMIDDFGGKYDRIDNLEVLLDNIIDKLPIVFIVIGTFSLSTFVVLVLILFN